MYVSQMHADQRRRIGLPRHIDLIVRCLGSSVTALAYAFFMRSAGYVIDSAVLLIASMVAVGLLALRILYSMGVWVSEKGLTVDRFEVRYRGFIRSWSVGWSQIDRVEALTLVQKNGDEISVGRGYSVLQTADMTHALRLGYQQSRLFAASNYPTCPPLIETERLQLKPWYPDDFDSFKSLYTSASIRRYMRYRLQRGKALTTRFKELIKPPPSARGCCWNWCISILDEQSGQPIIGFLDAWLAPTENAELVIAYGLSSRYQGQGLMSEALDRMCLLFLETWGMDAVRAVVLSTNQPSIKLLERSGFERRRQIKESDTVTYCRRPLLLSHDQVTENLERF